MLLNIIFYQKSLQKQLWYCFMCYAYYTTRHAIHFPTWEIYMCLELFSHSFILRRWIFKLLQDVQHIDKLHMSVLGQPLLELCNMVRMCSTCFKKKRHKWLSLWSQIGAEAVGGIAFDESLVFAFANFAGYFPPGITEEKTALNPVLLFTGHEWHYKRK